MYHVLDMAITLLHLAIIVFNLSGWAFHKTRRIHLLVMGLTILSWFVVGLWKGLGYCFLTDWHWNLKMHLGEKNLPASFITYMAEHITGLKISPVIVDRCTLIVLLCVIAATVYVNFFSKKTT